MLVRMYWSLWALLLLAMGVVFVTGNLYGVVLVAFGFVAFGMVFMGMMSVLPFVVAHPQPEKLPVMPSALKATHPAVRPVEQRLPLGSGFQTAHKA